MVVTLPFGPWSPLPLPYTSLTFLFIYSYLFLSVVTLRTSFSPLLFKKYGLALFLIWTIMLFSTSVFDNHDGIGAGSLLRQFAFFGTFFVFALKDANYLAARGENLHGYFLFAVVGLVIGYFGGYTRELVGTGRQTLIGVNANVVAMYSAAGFLILLDALLNARGVASRSGVRRVAIIFLIGLAAVVSLSGSRTGVIILGAGIAVYLVSWSRMTARQLYLVLPVGFAALGAVWLMMSSELMSSRLLEAREDIRFTVLWPIGMQVLLEYPLFGSGFGYVDSVITARTGRHLALHNEYLKIATSSGFVGLFLFLLVLKRMLDNALASRRVEGSGLQLSLWLIVVLYLVPGGGALQEPMIWVLFLMLAVPASPVGYHARLSRQRPEHVVQ